VDGPQILEEVTLVYVDFLKADGKRVFEHACRMGLRAYSRNGSRHPTGQAARTPGSSSNASRATRFPIIAFVEKLGARSRKIASLYVGRLEGDRLIYAGKARSGYTEVVAREVRERLDPLIRRTSPLSVPV
jgi:bifunctional non-homologous end joining protein LigD